jgi:nucleoside-diphosphate-sugar epimerase
MILVTGGSGFIGSHLARSLSKRGNGVRILDIIDFKERPREIEFYQGDVRDKKALERALQGVSVVYHTAALVPVTKAWDQIRDVNVGGTANLLNLCRKKSIKKFVYISSSAVYGMPESPVTLDSPLNPFETYGRTKLAAERLVEKYRKEGNSAIIVRPRTVLGNYRLGIFDILFEWVSENRNIYIIGRGDNLFQFVHVDDLVEATIMAAEKGRSGIFNIGTYRFGTLREDLVLFIKEVGSKSKVKSLPENFAIPALEILDKLHLSPLTSWHYLTYHRPFYFDISREMRVLGWKPRYSNKEMLVSTYEWYIKNRERRKDALNSPHHSRSKQKFLKVIKWFS